MIKIQRFVCNMIEENCYIVSDETREAAVIDCGAYYDEERKAVTAYIDREQLTVKLLLCTHPHFDHCFGNDTVWRHCQVLPAMPADDEWLTDLPRQMQQMLGANYDREVPPVGKLYTEDDVFSFGNLQFTVIHTPGHTPGSSMFYCASEKILFSGDTLFKQSIGRTDFPRGSWPQMQQSLRKVTQLPTDITVMPGHGPQTTIGDELRLNPYLRS